MSAVTIFDTKLMEERNYWLKRLESVAVATTRLDLGPRENGISPTGDETQLLSTALDKRGLQGRLGHRFDATLTSHLHRLTGSSPFLLYTLLVSGLKVCLQRYTDAMKVTVGSPPLAECDHANALVIVNEVRGEESFREFSHRVRQSLLDAYAHQRYPYPRLLKDLGLAPDEMEERNDAERAALFDVVAELEGFHGRLAEAGESLRLRFEDGIAEPATGEIAASSNTALSVIVEYDEQRYSHQLIARFILHCEEILRTAVGDTGRRIGELELLTPEERLLLLEEWNRTERPYPQDRRIHELFAEQAARTPERIALVSDRQFVSYRELDRRANQLGHYLQGPGVGAEALVGIFVERSIEMVVGVLGVLKAGGAYLPLDPESPPERLAFMLQDAGVRVTLTLQELKDRLPAHGGQTVCLDVEWESIGAEVESNPAPGPDSEVGPENLAYVIYTSGSTGRPKGVMIAHRGLRNLVEAQKEAFRIGDRSRVLQFSSLTFDASVSEIFSALIAGASLHIHKRERLMPGDDLLRVLREDQITTATLPPAVLAVLSEEELSHLQTVISAGEACTAEIAERWALGRRFLNAYGPTEATVCASIGEFESGSDGKPSIGRPIVNTRLYILDREMRPVPGIVKGDLYISGMGLARGYLGRAEQTAESFVPNPFSAEGGERFYRSGDLCRYQPDGRIEFLGRNDSQVKIRGFRIELGEIEARLRLHPAIREAVVLLREDRPGDKRLVAYYTVTTDQVASSSESSGSTEDVVHALGAEDLRAFLSESLPGYMTPAAYVELEALPLTPNGKVDRRSLPAPAMSGPIREYEAPVGKTEIALARIWAESLNLERVGRGDDFFELGGYSVLAVSMVERMRQEGLRTDVRAIFLHPTLAELAAVVETEWRF
jgi:amino acid adenylation domain-containing protein